MLNIAKIEAEIAKLMAEAGKLSAEGQKLVTEAGRINAEGRKLHAETEKIRREAPWQLTFSMVTALTALLGVAVALTKLFI